MPKVLGDFTCTLAEGPLYNEKEDTLCFVDIKEKKIHFFSLDSNELNTHEFQKEIGTFSFTNTNKLIVALSDGLYLYNLKTQDLEFLCNPETHLPNNRFNDGKCDKMGRFFAGTMDNFEEDISGSLYMYSQKKITQVETKLSISNGLGWNKNFTKFYLTDSPKRVIYEYDYDLTNATVSNKKIFTVVKEQDGYPDGLCLDKDDNIYSAHWDGFKITKYAPDGKILATISLPVPNVSSCCFGGKNYDTLFITTAKKGLSQEELAKYPQSGAIFYKKIDTQGLPPSTFKES